MSNCKNSILIIEDEEAIGKGLLFNFQAEGFHTILLGNGLEGIQFILHEHKKISVIILDLMLPQLDGFEILSQTRAIAEQIPILVLSAKSLELDRIRALECGADDYVTKPFSLSEVILRVKRLAQRKVWSDFVTSSHSSERFGNCIFSHEKLTLSQPSGHQFKLSPTEALLIQIFIENENITLTRADLLKKVWQYEAKVETRTVDVFIGKLRRYIEKEPTKPEVILSVRGVGYIYTGSKQED